MVQIIYTTVFQENPDINITYHIDMWYILYHMENKLKQWLVVFVRVIVFNATFNNISVILWQSVLLVEETGVPEENHWPAAISDNLYHFYQVHLAMRGIQTHNFSGR